MNEIKATYHINLKDYHMAVYFAAVMRHGLAVKIFLASGLTALACYLAASFGLMPPFMLPAYIFLGYLVWLLFTCAIIEHGVLKYAKNPGSILFKEMTVTFARGSMRVDTPYNGKSFSLPVGKLVCAFEMSNIFLLYIDAAQSIILPTRALPAGSRSELRSLLLNSLKDRFSTRYGYNSMLPRRSPLRK